MSVFSTNRILFIVDWDDTLLPTTALNYADKNIREKLELSKFQQTQLNILQLSVVNFLNKLKKYGNVCIITNSEEGWVNMSAKRYYPLIYNEILKYKCISARSKYNSETCKIPVSWKNKAMKQEIDLCFQKMNGLDKIFSFGDSNIDRFAFFGSLDSAKEKMLQVENKNLCCKSIKFAEKPTICQLNGQLNMLIDKFTGLIEDNNNADLMLTISMYPEDNFNYSEKIDENYVYNYPILA